MARGLSGIPTGKPSKRCGYRSFCLCILFVLTIHTFATLLLEQGVNPRVVQLYLGHHDIQTTLNTYSSVAAEVFDKAAGRVDDAYDAIMNGTYQPAASAL